MDGAEGAYRELLELCRRGDESSLHSLLCGPHGDDLRTMLREGQHSVTELPPPLLYASHNGAVDVVRYLVEKIGVDANSSFLYGETALMRAAQEGHLSVIKFLCEECAADANCASQLGATPLIRACYGNHQSVIRFLVENLRVNVNVDSQIMWTAVGEAAMRGNLETVKYLTERAGANILISAYHCRCPLIMSAAYGHLEVLRYLVDVHGRLLAGKLFNAMMMAAFRGHQEIVEFLMRKGVDVNSRNEANETPLMVAAMRGDLALVKALVVEGHADICAKNEWGQDAIVLARRGRKFEVVHFLYARSVRTKDTKTPAPNKRKRSSTW